MPGKHVIFLGAGASKQSGYPLANDLRLLISSRNKWEEKLQKYQSSNDQIASKGVDFWDKHVEILKLFRNGGFATLDEFCKLAATSSQFQSQINGLRGLVRAALGLFNPEEYFESSEYYGFVQSLFKDDLVSLREDVTVLTYNYDPYLEFLLYRALNQRRSIKIAGKSIAMSTDDIAEHNRHEQQLNAVTSGFYSHTNRDWLTRNGDKPSFCVLQLHGSICFPDPAGEYVKYETLFQFERSKRAEKLFEGNATTVVTPILFPWEIMTKDGLFKDSAFPFNSDKHLRPLFHGIWERARREIQDANKISFVGLSMHSFLFDGLKYLFEGKQGKVEIVIANPDNIGFVKGQTWTHWNKQPHSPGFTLSEVLGRIDHKMSRFGVLPGIASGDGDFTLVKNFADFIKTQMRPVET